MWAARLETSRGKNRWRMGRLNHRSPTQGLPHWQSMPYSAGGPSQGGLPVHAYGKPSPLVLRR